MKCLLHFRTAAREITIGFALAVLPIAVQAIGPNPRELLRSMSEFLTGFSAYSYHAEIEFDHVLPGGPKIRLSGMVDMAVSRPGSLFMHYRDDLSDRLVWLDDGNFTLVDPVAGTFAVVPGPKHIDGMVTMLEEKHGVTLPLAELAESDPAAVLTRDVQVVHYVGVHDVGGIHAHHLVLHREDLDMQIFIEVGDRPLPRKLVFEYATQLGSPQYSIHITKWRLHSPPPGVFAAKVPPDAARVEFLPAGEGQQ